MPDHPWMQWGSAENLRWGTLGDKAGVWFDISLPTGGFTHFLTLAQFAEMMRGSHLISIYALQGATVSYFAAHYPSICGDHLHHVHIYPPVWTLPMSQQLT